MPPAQKYEKVPASTATDDDFGALGIANDTLETTIDYQRNNSSNTNRTTSHHIGQRQHNSVDNTMAIQHHGNLTSTNSSQQLMGGDSESVTTSIAGSSTIDGRGASNGSLDTIKRPSSRTSHQYDGFATITRQEWFTVIVLCFVNLINYMDRFTIAGKKEFFFFSFLFSFSPKFIFASKLFILFAIVFVYCDCLVLTTRTRCDDRHEICVFWIFVFSILSPPQTYDVFVLW